MHDIVISDLCKRYGATVVLHHFSMTLPAGQTLCLMGRSGCGKTTLLRLLLGLEDPDSGTVTGLPPRLSVVFQEDRLCSTLSAVQNVRLAARGVPEEAVRALLAELGLTEEIDRPVQQFSGGMRRRVAIARALLAPGDLVLMDEPFQGLDPATRATVIACIRRRCAGRTLLVVTHDAEDAVLLACPVVHMAPHGA